MGLLDYLREQLNPPNSLLDRKYVDKYQEWQPEAKRVGGQALEAPMFAPDDLIGTGIPSKLATLLAPALKTAAVGAAPLATMGLLSKAAEQKGVTTVANKLAQALDGQAGAIAWHGSPHKFDKFDLAKIGTGEGAQAYGHGLYLAESPKVAIEYQQKLSSTGSAKNLAAQYGGVDNGLAEAEKRVEHYKKLIADGGGGDLRRANGMLSIAQKNLDDLRAMQSGLPENTGALYKTDIPDEAVARFLDWDKPLSQQAPEVQAAIEKMKKHVPGGMFSESLQPFERGNSTGSSLHRAFESDIASTGNGQASKTFSMLANEYGIPGIRYLDGGSRSAGQGSSNFVVFDPEMIRILERNGQATGAQPWKPGEWGGLLGSP